MLLVLLELARGATGDTGASTEIEAQTGDTGLLPEAADTGADTEPAPMAPSDTAALPPGGTGAWVAPSSVTTASSLAGEEGGVRCDHGRLGDGWMALLSLIALARRARREAPCG